MSAFRMACWMKSGVTTNSFSGDFGVALLGPVAAADVEVVVVVAAAVVVAAVTTVVVEALLVAAGVVVVVSVVGVAEEEAGVAGFKTT